MYGTDAIPVPGRLADDLLALRGRWMTGENPPDAAPLKGAYVLALCLEDPLAVEIRGADYRFRPGWYLYAGCARGGGGIGARVARHLRREKAIHWHIDRLTPRAARVAALAVPHGVECDLVGRLIATGRYTVPVKGFGSSDCRNCQAHLLAARY
ncbi:DUF123 domain-containing protein [Nitratireductor sp. XY-223]|uniref:DUF123 domain-containing protein n=1 Tax=Nitratireductor sp. XY-223 TaxID=2561926 RepID=UPI00197E65C3|nr:DUF123 domain-containing protein [Nitratireductor sp. XY-223]